MKEITETIAKEVLANIDQGLRAGKGYTVGDICVEQAVALAMGEGFTDQPSCVAPSLRMLKISLNDSVWSSHKARANGLRELGLAQLGSASNFNEKEFAERVTKLTITKVLPWVLRLIVELPDISSHKKNIVAAALQCERDGTRAAAKAAANAADAASAAANAAYAAAAAANAAYAAAYAAAANAAYAAAYAADAAAYATASATANAAANAADAAANAANALGGPPPEAVRDKVLGWFAEAVIEILVDMKAPGTQWLYLARKK